MHVIILKKICKIFSKIMMKMYEIWKIKLIRNYINYFFLHFFKLIFKLFERFLEYSYNNITINIIIINLTVLHPPVHKLNILLLKLSHSRVRVLKIVLFDDRN